MHQTSLRGVIAIADQKSRRLIACIQRHSVRGIELLEIVPLGAEVHQVLAGFVELEDMVAGISIG